MEIAIGIILIDIGVALVLVGLWRIRGMIKPAGRAALEWLMSRL